jgi:hypothetical protein
MVPLSLQETEPGFCTWWQQWARWWAQQLQDLMRSESYAHCIGSAASHFQSMPHGSHDSTHRETHSCLDGKMAKSHGKGCGFKKGRNECGNFSINAPIPGKY